MTHVKADNWLAQLGAFLDPKKKKKKKYSDILEIQVHPLH